MSKYDNLIKEILSLSEERKDFNTARHEWELVETKDIPKSTCLCKHNPIRECCYIVNNLNGNDTMVGNCCIKHFQNLPNVDWYFQGLRRIRNTETPNQKMLGLLYAQHKLTYFEYNFLLSIHNKKKYTPKQLETKKLILNKLNEVIKNETKEPIQKNLKSML